MGNSALILAGRVANGTKRNWSLVNFDFTPSDATNAKLHPARLTLFELAAGTEKNFTSSLGQTDFESLEPSVSLRDGTFPVIYSFALTKPVESNTLKFEDQRTAFTFKISSESVEFDINNKADVPPRLKWDDAAFVEVSGESKKVMHKGVRFVDRNTPQPATTIPPMASYRDFLLPTDRLELTRLPLRLWRAPCPLVFLLG